MIPRSAVIRVAAEGIVVCLLALRSPREAAAAPPAPKPAESEHPSRALFQRAEASFQAGRYGEALADYRAAYELEPLPGFLFNIGQCYRNMHEYERARFFYRRYLALDPRSSNRDVAEALIADMTRLIGEQHAAASSPPIAETTRAPASGRQVALSLPANGAIRSPESAPPSLISTATGGGAGSDGLATPARPFYRRWWFWTGVGAVAAGGAVTAILLTRSSPEGSLRPITVSAGYVH